MDRRHFLTAALTTAALWRSRPARSQDGVVTRGAVVIGVDRAGNLTPLKAARSGADAVAAWLRAEGFDVKLFTDRDAAVTTSSLFNAVNAYVEAGTLDQLVIYFAGHGFISGSLSEFWMLSGAPQNPNEAVSLTESCRYAEESGIPNVVFISDACRSRADSLGTQRLQGGVLFPATTNPRTVSDVDQFLAARIGTAAYEVAPAADPSAAQGIFTGCFLEAFKNPYPGMIHTVDGKQVVPNRRLKGYLTSEVPKKAQALSVAYNQMPDSRVLSDEPTYIAHVSSAGRTPAPTESVSMSEVASAQIWTPRGPGIDHSDGHPSPPRFTPALRTLSATSGFDAAKLKIEQSRSLPAELPKSCGFMVSGQSLRTVTHRPEVKAKFSNSLDSRGRSAFVNVDLGGLPSASIALRFENGTGTVLAALRNFAGNVLVGKSGVSNVSYVPARESPLRQVYERESAKLEELRATVATAAQYGVFRFDGPKHVRTQTASAMADRIRLLKGIDPTLGLYAAYAYDDAALRDKVQSVEYAMRDTLDVNLCDVAMLSGTLARKSISDSRSFVPFCPMLSQGWGLLRVKKVQLAESIAAAGNHLNVSLWNSLSSKGMDLVEHAIRSGEVR
jgi:hypothetical protein